MIKTYCKYKEIEIIFQVLTFNILDYAGFVPGIKSENLFGKTFGKITLLSSTHEHHRGYYIIWGLVPICLPISDTRVKWRKHIVIRGIKEAETSTCMGN